MTIVNFGHLQGNWRQPISLEADRCGPPSRFAFQLFPSGGLTSTPQGPRLPLALFFCLAGLGAHQRQLVATTMPDACSVSFVTRSSPEPSATGRPSSISRTRVEHVSCSASASNRWQPAREWRASRKAWAASHGRCRARAPPWISNIPSSCHEGRCQRGYAASANLLLEF